MDKRIALLCPRYPALAVCLVAILILSGAHGITHAQTFSIDLEEVSEYLARTTPDDPFDTLRTDISFLALGEHGRVPNFLPSDFERVHVLEEFGVGGKYRVTFSYPRTHSFHFRETRRGVFLYLQPRDLTTPGLAIDLETIDQLVDHRYRESSRAVWRETVVNSINSQKEGEGGFSGLSFNVPIKLPGFMESMVGEGEKTHIDISGRESITFAGESRVVKPFIGSEGQQKQSLFPSLDMKQELDVRLNGQIGEKIHIQVDHSSNALSDNNNNIRMNYRGLDDDIIKLIELGNTNLSLPGSELVSFSTSSQGLFGIKTLAQIGPAEITFIASKEEGEASRATFVPQGGTIGQRETRTIFDYQFVANKFFFFDDPFPPRGIVPLVTDSIEVFRSIQLFERNDNPDSWFGRAYLDTIGDGSLLDAPGDPFEGRLFKLLNFGDDYRFIVDAANEQLVTGVELIRPINTGQVLAVRYVNDNGDMTGDYGVTPASDADSMRLELIWPASPLREGKFGATWNFMMRNIYNLGLSNIEPTTFEFEIHDADNRLDTTRPDSSTVSWVRIFGLDRTDETFSGPPDNRIDLTNVFINLQTGLLQFPILTPFNPGDADVAVWTDGLFSFDDQPETKKNPEIYTSNRPEDFSKYRIEISAASTSRTFRIDAFNISENSEVVRLDGRQLTKGTDYTINYETGEVELLGSVLEELTPSSNITIDYEFKPFAGGGSNSLIGFNSQVNLSQNAKFGTTWLYESRSSSTTRPRLGEEPTRTVVGDVNGSVRFHPGILTSLINILPLVDTDAKSSFSLNGELAMSMPDPNTLGRVYIDDFEGTEDSDLIPMNRRAWSPASPPIDPDGNGIDKLLSSDKLRAFWYNIEPDLGVHRRDLNPSLNEQENSLIPSLDIELDTLTTNEARWTGVMTGFAGGGIDISKGQFIEIWINDFQPDSTKRGGKIHIDMGFIDEDFYEPDANEENTEDEGRDGFNASNEDLGLDNLQFGTTDPGPPVRAADTDDVFTSGRQNGRFSQINGTEGNGILDDEDLDRNGQMDETNGYFEYEVDLKSPAAIDIREQFPDYELFGDPNSPHVNDSWRLYRIELSNNRQVKTNDTPTLEQIKHIRIWFDSTAATMSGGTGRIQIVDFKIVGNRWERDGLRASVGGDSLLVPSDFPSTKFAIGVISTKTDPTKYIPPFVLASENDVLEKEQSLFIRYENLLDTLDMGLRIRKRFSGVGLDLSSYRDLSFLVFTDQLNSAVDYYFQLAFDSTSYYEVRVPLSTQYFGNGEWAWVTITMSDLTDLKFAQPDSNGVTSGKAQDVNFGRTYDVRLIGRPSLFNVRFLYAGLRNMSGAPVSGEIWMNDLFLGNRKQDIDFAQRLSGSLSMGNIITLNAAWRKTGADFRGLRQRRGSGNDATSYSFNVRSGLQHFLPLFGFRLPVSGNYRRSLSLPKFVPNSDTEITTESLQDSLRSETITRGFSTSLSKRNSKNPLIKYTFDKLTTSFSMSQTRRRTSASADTILSMSGNADYSINWGPKRRIKIWKKTYLRYWFNAMSFRLNASRRKGVRWRVVGGQPVRDPDIFGADIGTSGSLTYVPVRALTSSYRLTTRRDLRQGTYELFGVNIGRETNRTQVVNVTFRPPPIWIVGAFNPDFNINTRYVENAGANVRRPGDLPTIRNVSNNRNASLKMQFDIGRYLGKIFRTVRIIDKDSDDGRGTRAPPRGGGKDAPGDTTATDEPAPATSPMFLVRATARMLSRIRKIDASVQQRQVNSYSRIPGRPAVDYQLGLTTNTGVTLGPDKFDQPLRFTKSLGFTLDSGVQVTDNIDVAARFNQTRSHNEINSSVTFSRTRIWPDVNLNWKGLETLGPLSRLFLATNANVGYRATTRESGRGETVDATTLSRSLTPTASFQWRNGLGSALSFQWTNNQQETRGATSETSAISVSMDMKYTFNPGSNLRIPLPFFGSKKLRSRLDTNLNMSYARTGGKRGEVEIPGTSIIRVAPRLTYNFTRALNGSFFIDYSRNHTDATNQTTTTLRIGLSAIFTF